MQVIIDYIEFKAIQGYMRACLENTNNYKKEKEKKRKKKKERKKAG